VECKTLTSSNEWTTFPFLFTCAEKSFAITAQCSFELGLILNSVYQLIDSKGRDKVEVGFLYSATYMAHQEQHALQSRKWQLIAIRHIFNPLIIIRANLFAESVCSEKNVRSSSSVCISLYNFFFESII